MKKSYYHKCCLHPQIHYSISAFFPCYNDAMTIGKLVDNVEATLQNLTRDYEIIVVDDKSRDESPKILRQLSKKNKRLTTIFHKKNKGYGGALKSGIRAARKDLIFFTDGDGQYDVNELPILLALMTNDTNFVNGIKMFRNDSTHRIFLGKIYSFIARVLFFLPVFDVDCAFRLIRRDLIQNLPIKSNSSTFNIELVKNAQRAGGRFRQASVHHYKRPHGSSEFFRLGKLSRTLADLVQLWVRLMIINQLYKRQVRI